MNSKRVVAVMLSALVWRAFIGCGGTSSGGGAGGSSGASGGAGQVMDDPSCSRYGLRYAATCDGCPAEPLSCPCFAPNSDFGFSPFQRCNFGRCLLEFDCTEICRAISAFVSDVGDGSPIPPDLFEEVTKLRSCVTDRSCKADSGCGATGKCVGESTSQVGKCTAGNALCQGPSDCWSGICVVNPSGAAAAGGSSTAAGGSVASGAGGTIGTDLSSINGSCRDGMPGSYCADDSQCLRGKCLVGFNSVCTRGNVGEPCRRAEDCAGGTFCVRPPAVSMEELGVCRAGLADDACGEDAQCQSGACVVERCSSGENRSPCLKPAHCRSGFCAIQPPALPTDFTTGVCDSGETGALCGLNSDCKSAHCALRSSPDQYGICTDGKSGDPCVLAADCNTQLCTVTRLPDGVAPCDPGGACGQGGVCDSSYIQCQYGRCN